jgi:hypothetical protein
MAHRISVKAIARTPQPAGVEKGRADLAAILRELGAGEVVALDMRGIRLVDSSWAREVIGTLVAEEPRGSVFYLDGVEFPVVAENVDAALFRGGHAILARTADGSHQVLGRPPSAEALEVLKVIERDREVTARSVCSAIGGLASTACNNRLKDLLSARLVVRQESNLPGGGREFMYRALN